MTEYMVVTQRVIGGDTAPIEVMYASDGKRFSDNALAIKHGLRKCGSDDFNIAAVNGKRVVAFYWMDERLDYTSEFPQIAEAIGL